MVNFTISIFGNKIFLEVLNELKFFSKYNVKYYDDLNLCIKNASNLNQLAVFFITATKTFLRCPTRSKNVLTLKY